MRAPARGTSRRQGYGRGMNFDGTTPTPARHTLDGGVLVGSDGARRRLVVFEDAQCPYSRQFEEVSGDLLRREVAAGAVAVEYRMRCFLGPESVRAVNALALAAETGRFDELRRELFAAQPPEHTGGFTTEDLLDFGRRAGLAIPARLPKSSRSSVVKPPVCSGGWAANSSRRSSSNRPVSAASASALTARTDSGPRKHRIRYSTATAPAATSRRSRSPDTSSNCRLWGHCGSSKTTSRRRAPTLPTSTPPSGVWRAGVGVVPSKFMPRPYP